MCNSSTNRSHSRGRSRRRRSNDVTTAAESLAATAEVDDMTTVVKSTEISHRLKEALLLKVCHMLMVNGFATKSCHVSSVK